MIDSIDGGKKSFNNVRHLIMIKTEKPGLEENFLDLRKSI